MSKFNIQMTNDWVRHTDTSTEHGHETMDTDTRRLDLDAKHEHESPQLGIPEKLENEF